MKLINLKLLFSGGLLLVLVYVVSKAININDLNKVIFSFPREQLLMLLTLSFIINVLKAWRFLVLLRFNKIKISFFDTVKTYIASQTTSPLPGGEALRGILVKRESGE